MLLAMKILEKKNCHEKGYRHGTYSRTTDNLYILAGAPVYDKIITSVRSKNKINTCCYNIVSSCWFPINTVGPQEP
jgi:hypothetical protein